MIRAVLIGTILLVILLAMFIIFIVYFMNSYYKLNYEKKKQEIKQQQVLAEATIRSEENERKRIAENLHDDIAPILLRVRRKLESQLEISNGMDMSNINMALEYVDSGMNRIRDVTHILHPSAIESSGLISALKDFCATMENSMNCEMDMDNEIDEVDLSKFKQLMLFRVVQELVINAVKHGKARQFYIHILLKDQILNLSIYHNGSVFLEDDYQKGLSNLNTLGLKYIKQRLELLFGKIEFATYSERGEQNIQILCPLDINTVKSDS